MAKKIRAVLTLQIEAGKANPAPPVGPALGQHGINIMGFCKEYNEKTSSQAGMIVPAEITVFEDRSFSFVLKTPPASDLLKKAAGIEKGSSAQKREKVATIGRAEVRKIAEMMRQIKAEGGRIVFVAGPVVIHTGGSAAFCELIRSGYVDALLAGNAIAVHDIEHQFFGTSLGVDLNHGIPIEEGHKNHMRAINTINRYGSIRGAVEAGALRSGVMYECVTNNVPFVLAGSIRDDGPLPDTEMDLVKAQEEYARLLADAKMVVCLSSMLHSIGAGNMLPSWVRMVCVDINPAVVTKLSDRGSQQTVGVVTDVGTFLNLLAQQLWT